MVQRYSKYGSDNHFIDRHGKWVRFEDYAKLEALYAAAVEHMVLVYNSYNADVSPALEELYEKASGANEPSN